MIVLLEYINCMLLCSIDVYIYCYIFLIVLVLGLMLSVTHCAQNYNWQVPSCDDSYLWCSYFVAYCQIVYE